ncbi:MAG: hypothetical protein DMF82_12400 [Acidobacteria bacterium]|nr:MAG: hypothetical protein DMF82_12400 [Acidobacteriota bacterium]
MRTRYCTNCEEEFRPEILRCSDCGGELEDRYEEEDAEGRPIAAPKDAKAEAPEPPEPPDEYQAVFQSVDSAPIKEAADVLAAARLRFRVTAGGSGFTLLVRTGDVPAAGAALTGKEGSLVIADAKPSVGAEGGACPACGSSVAPGVLECPECGLVVGAEPEPE